MEQLTLEKISECLLAKELIDAQNKQTILSFTKTESETPWYIYALIAIAAWFSTIFFVAFFFLVMFQNAQEVALVAGVLLSVVAVAINQGKQKESIFFSQVSLAFNVAGQILMVLGFFIHTHSIVVICFFVIVLQVVMTFLYRHPVQYFVAPMVISCALFFLLLDIEGNTRALKGPQSIHFVIALLSTATGYFWYKESSFVKHRFFHYSLYGTTLSLLVMVSLSVFSRSYDLEMWWVSGIIVGVALILLEIELLGDLLKTTMGTTIIVASALFCIITINSPGLIAAMFTLILGFYRGHKLLMSISCVFFGGFLFFFYYDLQMTLLSKSLILMGSGIVLIAFSIVVSRAQLGEENA